jgi:hypothetical protein
VSLSVVVVKGRMRQVRRRQARGAGVGGQDLWLLFVPRKRWRLQGSSLPPSLAAVSSSLPCQLAGGTGGLPAYSDGGPASPTGRVVVTTGLRAAHTAASLNLDSTMQ